MAIAVCQRIKARDPIYLYDCGAMDAQESATVEACFERVQGFAKKVPLAVNVQAGVIAYGFDPINLFGLDKGDVVASSNGELLHCRVSALVGVIIQQLL